MLKNEGRDRALLLGVLFPNTSCMENLVSVRLMHLRNPAFSTDLCCLLLKPAHLTSSICASKGAITAIPTAGHAALLLLMQTRGIPQHSKPLAIHALALTEGGKDTPCCFKSCLFSWLWHEQLNMVQPLDISSQWGPQKIAVITSNIIQAGGGTQIRIPGALLPSFTKRNLYRRLTWYLVLAYF